MERCRSGQGDEAGCVVDFAASSSNMRKLVRNVPERTEFGGQSWFLKWVTEAMEWWTMREKELTVSLK